MDHIAFITSDITFIKNVLDDEGVFYKEDFPNNTGGIWQIFVFDPDYNVIEISNCWKNKMFQYTKNIFLYIITIYM